MLIANIASINESINMMTHMCIIVSRMAAVIPYAASSSVASSEIKSAAAASLPDFNGEWRSTGHNNLEAFLVSQKFPAKLVAVAAKAVVWHLHRRCMQPLVNI